MRILYSFVLSLVFSVAEARDFSAWDDRELIGQLLMVGYRNDSQVTELKAGGLVFFSWSLRDVHQAQALLSRLNKLSKLHQKAPVFLAVDHEGGKVLRLRSGLTMFPDAAVVGAARDQDMAEAVGASMGLELRSLGFNMNLAPVLDLGNAKSFLENRVWGTDPETVATLAARFMQGLHASGVIAVPKHFPGHGTTDVDSHFDLPRINRRLEDLRSFDLLPFMRVVAKGARAIMTAHVEMPAIDSGPASLSSVFVSQILRRELGFSGIVVTDDLEMGGITKRLGLPVEDLALRSLQSGTDVVMVVWNKDMQKVIADRLARALANGEISRSWLEEKVARIIAVKEQFDLHKDQGVNQQWKANLRKPEALRLSMDLRRRALKWEVGDSSKILSSFALQRKDRWVVILPGNAAAQLWRQHRNQDKLMVVARRADGAVLAQLSSLLDQALRSKTPVVVVTGPRASSSEEAFSLVRRSLGAWEADTQRAVDTMGPVVWLHQGARPFEIKKSAGEFRLGVVSLHSSSLASFKLFLDELNGVSVP